MKYQGIIIRPPSEADSYLLQITYGCSHNQCAFCGTYLDQPFKVRPLEDVLKDIDSARRYAPETRRVFLCDGDAMMLPTRQVLMVLQALSEAFPDLQRVGIYANARDILKKSDAELTELNKHKLAIAYLGLESGNDEVLKRVKKGATAKEMVEAVKKAQANGIKISVIGLLGLGGKELSREHALDTGRAVSEMNPRYFSLLTLMLVPGTPIFEEERRGEFILSSPLELLQEMRLMVEHIDSSRTIFRTNHASNYAPIGGTFNKDKPRILAEIDNYLEGKHDVRPEFLRGL